MKHSNLLGKALSVVTASAMLVIGNTAFPENTKLNAYAADQTLKGSINGYDYELINESGIGNITMAPGANSFNSSWEDIEEFDARMGANYKPLNKDYKNLSPNFKLSYDVEFTPMGNSFIGAYGTTSNPHVEYYIVEGWGDWRPPGGTSPIDSVVSNGLPYDIFETKYYNVPSLDGAISYSQYWSVRKTSASNYGTTSNIKATINVSDHFKAFEDAGFDMSGSLDGLYFNVKGFRKDGSANVKNLNIYPTFAYSTVEATADEVDYIFNDGFEGTDNNWAGRLNETVEASSAAALSGSGSLSVSGRTANWNGAAKALSSDQFSSGSEYSFSANVMYDNGPDEQTFQLSLQYSDGSSTQYDHIASATAIKGEWVQLANTNYTIPSGASDVRLYVETDENDTDYIDFYVDDVAAAPAGTKIKGAEPPKKAVMGDVNFDGTIDSLDMIAARKGIIAGNFKGSALKAADVDQNGAFETADLVLIQSYILGKISDWPEPVIVEPVIDTSKWDNYKETASSQYIDFYKSSIKHFGNTYRLDKKLAAAESGESLTIAYLGGSITEGKNYTTPFSNYVKSTFAKGSFKEINAGLSGTSSVVGLVRSEQEIISKNADIIFLEFSVNDHEDIMYKKCFESCIKKFLDMPNEPAVIVLITRAQGGFSSQSQMYPIGKNFDIPVISMDDALTKAFNSGFLKTSDYYQDEYHPHQKGGQLISDCLAYYFRQAMKSEHLSTSYSIPTKAVYGMEYADCVNVNPKNLDNFSAGSWTAGSGYNNSPSLNYSYTLNGGNPMKFKTTGKGLIIVFKANSSGMGSINVTVNGKTTKVNGNKQYTWGGPDAELGYYQSNSGELDVSISGSGSFTIWGIGLIK